MYGHPEARYRRGEYSEYGGYGTGEDPGTDLLGELFAWIFSKIRSALFVLAPVAIWTGLILAGNGVAVTQSGIAAFAGALLLIVAFGAPGSGIPDFSSQQTAAADEAKADAA